MVLRAFPWEGLTQRWGVLEGFSLAGPSLRAFHAQQVWAHFSIHLSLSCTAMSVSSPGNFQGSPPGQPWCDFCYVRFSTLRSDETTCDKYEPSTYCVCVCMCMCWGVSRCQNKGGLLGGGSLWPIVHWRDTEISIYHPASW